MAFDDSVSLFFEGITDAPVTRGGLIMVAEGEDGLRRQESK